MKASNIISFYAASLLVMSWMQGCVSSDHSTQGGPRGEHSIIVEVANDGTPSMFGESLSFQELSSKLKRKGADEGRPVALYCSERTTQTAILSLMRRLNQAGIPNVSIVTAERISSDLIEDTNGIPGEPEKPLEKKTLKKINTSGSLKRAKSSSGKTNIPASPKIFYK